MTPHVVPGDRGDFESLLAAVREAVAVRAHRRPDPGIDRDDEDEESDRPIGEPDEDEGYEDDEDEDDDEEPLQV